MVCYLSWSAKWSVLQLGAYHAQVNGLKGTCYKGYKSKHEVVAAYNSQVIEAELKLANFENKEKKCDFTCKDIVILVLVVIIIILLCKMM